MTSGISDGNMSPRWGEADAVADNRTAFFWRNGITESCVILCSVPQQNGVSIIEVDGARAGQAIVADALISRDTSLTLGLLTADCLPVVISGGEWLGIAHCGWSSTDQRLAERVIQTLKDREVDPRDLRVWIGPSIKAISYTLPASEVTQKGDSRWQPYLRAEGGRVHIDLHGYVHAQCIENGVSPERIAVFPSDTFTDSAYFSHRRSKATGEREGRMMTLVSPTTI